jgi:hypothetical protein
MLTVGWLSRPKGRGKTAWAMARQPEALAASARLLLWHA